MDKPRPVMHAKSTTGSSGGTICTVMALHLCLALCPLSDLTMFMPSLWAVSCYEAEEKANCSQPYRCRWARSICLLCQYRRHRNCGCVHPGGNRVTTATFRQNNRGS